MPSEKLKKRFRAAAARGDGEHEKDVGEMFRDAEYQAEECKASASEDINRAFNREGIKRSELQKRFGGVSRQYISGILNESRNFSIETLAKLSAALHCHLVVRILSPDEAMPLVPVSALPDVRSLIHGLPTQQEQALRRFYGMALISNDSIQPDIKFETGVSPTEAFFVTGFNTHYQQMLQEQGRIRLGYEARKRIARSSVGSSSTSTSAKDAY